MERPVPGAVGRRIARQAVESPIMKRLELELGGNTPFVVLSDADLDQATEAAVFGKFRHQGQICMAINRLIVDERLYGNRQSRGQADYAFLVNMSTSEAAQLQVLWTTEEHRCLTSEQSAFATPPTRPSLRCT